MGKALRWALLVAAVGAGLYVGLRVSRWLMGDLEPTVLEAGDLLRRP